MTDRMAPRPQGMSVGDQAELIRTHGIDLFSLSEHRFGDRLMGEGETSVSSVFRDRVRHRTEDGLITVNPLELSVDGRPEADPESPVSVNVDTPLPSTGPWPNAYVREAFLFGLSEDLTSSDAPYGYELTVEEFASDGRHIPDGRSVGLRSESGGIEASAVDGIDREFAHILGGVEEAADGSGSQSASERLQEQKLAVMRRLFPEIMERFQTPCLPERFQEVFRAIMALTPQLGEVGCEPSPYMRV